MRSICGMRRVDRVRNAKKRERCRCELSALERIVRKVLKWLGHVKRMREERLVRRVYRANVQDNRGGGRPQRRWRYEVKELMFGRGLSEMERMVLTRDRDAWG